MMYNNSCNSRTGHLSAGGKKGLAILFSGDLPDPDRVRSQKLNGENRLEQSKDRSLV